MPQVFISYAHVNPDQELAAQLHRHLEAAGVDVFVDSKIGLGQNWAEQIDLQLRASTHLVALLSGVSVQSDMVRREIAIAYKLKRASQLAILPVRLDFQGELPYELAAYLDLIQYASWRAGESFDPICRAIVEAVRGTAPKQPQAPIFGRLELESITLRLAHYLGPAAHLVVKQAAQKAANWEQLFDLLAVEVPVGKERQTFQASRFGRKA